MSLAGMPKEPGLLRRFVARYDQTKLIRAVFYGLVIGTGFTLWTDYQELAQRDAALSGAPSERRLPVLPDSVRTDTNRPDITADEDVLRAPMAIRLDRDGVLALTGTIVPGIADRLRDEVARLGEYVREVYLNSPGGSVDDALAMSQLIRDKGFATRVKGGNLCASSCPLVFAGGVERVAEEGAAIGVHQIYAGDETITNSDVAMSAAQAVTARITRHLIAMGVDPALWTHAMETPPAQLYYLTPDEMVALKLVTASQ
jgi:hypothetical protein